MLLHEGLISSLAAPVRDSEKVKKRGADMFEDTLVKSTTKLREASKKADIGQR